MGKGTGASSGNVTQGSSGNGAYRKINETKTTSETIAVANDVVSRFNARHRLPEHEGDTGTN